ncbi:hypothetical protein UA08_06071 [Talaromyces atroroseus]|uniref:OPA3-like protein n=1 Tax=Talaromyces atroroseus TaxID=1441469 RepID=A0A225AGR8_TALAT|nr:hypothetical protein UA08_06071 [Talaromyces atroroseus]OKL58383.1 hypothetical protein UA08_06071 [Talaromyces atroroseus]
MSLTLKLSSLVIRTLSKPIANSIKAQAREHERFRRTCVSIAQAVHRIDMRLRLGLLRDTAAIEAQAAKEAAEAQARKHKPKSPTAKTEAESKAEEEEAAQAKKQAIEKARSKPLPRIRPLSESKAIDSGANFISETFLFLVAGGLIVFESWRSRRKETNRQTNVQDRLNELEESEKAARRALGILEKELIQLKAHQGKHPVKDVKRILPSDVWEDDGQEVVPKAEQDQSWASWISSYFPSSEKTAQKPEAVQPIVPTSTADKATTSPSGTESPHSIIPTILTPHPTKPSPKDFHAVVSASLRGRPVWEVLLPILDSNNELTFEDSPDNICDLTFYCPNETWASNVEVHCILVTPPDIEATNRQATLIRAEKLAIATHKNVQSRCDRVIVFVCSATAFQTASRYCSIDGFVSLQVLLFDSPSAAALPIIIVGEPSELLSSIKERCQVLQHHLDQSPERPHLGSSASSLRLLEHIVAHASDSVTCQQNLNILSDLFPSLRALSAAIRTMEGRQLIADYLGSRVARNIVAFWSEERIAVENRVF